MQSLHHLILRTTDTRITENKKRFVLSPVTKKARDVKLRQVVLKKPVITTGDIICTSIYHKNKVTSSASHPVTRRRQVTSSAPPVARRSNQLYCCQQHAASQTPKLQTNAQHLLTFTPTHLILCQRHKTINC